MKTCNGCKIEKSLTEFSKCQSKKDGLQPKCKVCFNELNKEFRQKNPNYYKQQWSKKSDNVYSVYLLKDEHYVGMTKHLYGRFKVHKNVFKRNTNNTKILFASFNKKEAIEIEKQFHNMGFNGRNGNY